MGENCAVFGCGTNSCHETGISTYAFPKEPQSIRRETDCEIVWVRVKIRGQRSLLICSFYRPNVSDTPSLEAFYESLGQAAATQHLFIIAGGDFNLPGWDWTRMELKPDTAYPALHRTFLNTIQGYGMKQMVEANTRLDNTLYLMITNFPDRPRQEAGGF